MDNVSMTFMAEKVEVKFVGTPPKGIFQPGTTYVATLDKQGYIIKVEPLK